MELKKKKARKYGRGEEVLQETEQKLPRDEQQGGNTVKKNYRINSKLHISRPDYAEGGTAHLELCLERLPYMFKDSQHLEWTQWTGSVRSLRP